MDTSAVAVEVTDVIVGLPRVGSLLTLVTSLVIGDEARVVVAKPVVVLTAVVQFATHPVPQ